MTTRSTAIACAALALLAPKASAQADRGQAIVEWIDRIAAVGSMAAVSVAVVEGDSVLVLRARGMADVEAGREATTGTRFYVASTTKTFTALALATLDHRGEVSLDSSLASFLPEARLQAPLSPRGITLRDLLAMRDGIGEGPVTLRTSYTGEWTAPGLVRLLASHAPAPTGNAFRYSNIGYIVAALAVERRLGHDWRTLVEREVLAPLDMRQTASRLADVPRDSLAMPHAVIDGRMQRIALAKSDRTLHAAGGHFSTAADLARLLRMELGDGRLDGRQRFPAPVLAERRRSHVAQDRDVAFRHRVGWGLGWDIATYQGDTIYERPGGFTGYYSHVSMIPARRQGVVVLATVSSGAAEAIVQGTYDILAGRATAARIDSLHARVAGTYERVRTRSETAIEALPVVRPTSDVVGRFASAAWGTLDLVARGDTLVARMGDSHGSVRRAPEGGVLVARLLGDEQRLTPVRDRNGQVQAVVLDTMRFTRSAAAGARR